MVCVFQSKCVCVCVCVCIYVKPHLRNSNSTCGIILESFGSEDRYRLGLVVWAKTTKRNRRNA